jgi:hypothetical protein
MILSKPHNSSYRLRTDSFPQFDGLSHWINTLERWESSQFKVLKTVPILSKLDRASPGLPGFAAGCLGAHTFTQSHRRYPRVPSPFLIVIEELLSRFPFAICPSSTTIWFNPIYRIKNHGKFCRESGTWFFNQAEKWRGNVKISSAGLCRGMSAELPHGKPREGWKSWILPLPGQVLRVSERFLRI